MLMSRVLCVFMVVASAMSSIAMATDRYFADSAASSLNGRYRIDAKSPDNAPGRRRPFASNFTYTLTDTTTGKVVWERKQPMTRQKGEPRAWAAESSPLDVFVHDDGTVAAELVDHTLLLLDAKSGRTIGSAELFEKFPEAEQNAYASFTSAGTFWSHNSVWYFVAVPELAAGDAKAELYFVVRPYWSHRLIVRVSEAAHVDLGTYHSATSETDLQSAPERLKGILSACLREESRLALAALDSAPVVLADQEDREGYWTLLAALRTTTLLRMPEALPKLRSLEQTLDAAIERQCKVRARVRECIRAQGQQPASGCGVRVPMVVVGNVIQRDYANPFDSIIDLQVRAKNAVQIREGMAYDKVIALIGCPDAEVDSGGQTYDYDMDGENAYTLRVAFDEKRSRVTGVERIVPFAFFNDRPRIRN